MPRAARSVAKRARHKKWLKRAKGFRGRRSTVFKLAKEAVLKAGQHAYFDRRKKKTHFRALQQVRINAGAREAGTTYSRLMHTLKLQGSVLDRKVLAELASRHAGIFKQLVENVEETAKKAVPKR